jgi:hypothetical protein
MSWCLVQYVAYTPFYYTGVSLVKTKTEILSIEYDNAYKLATKDDAEYIKYFLKQPGDWHVEEHDYF